MSGLLVQSMMVSVFASICAGIIFLRKSVQRHAFITFLIYVAASPVFASAAHAENATQPDDSLTMAGITLYGTVDLGIAYQTHGTPLNDYYPPGLEYLITKNSNNSITTLAPNGMSQSKIGIKGTEEIVDGWSGIFKLETGFDPTSGQISDALKSMSQNNGVALNAQTSNLDSSRAGQLFQGAGYAGFSSPTYGTLTFGRQNGVLTDNITKYDPQGGSYAFSVIGFSGTAAGSGASEDARLDDSLRYIGKVGLARMDFEYQFRDMASGGGTAYELGLGTDYRNLSVDAIYVKKNDAISAAPLSSTQYTALSGAGLLQNNSLAATISDNTSSSIMAKYDAGASKVYAGYEHITYADPSSPITSGFNDIGGYSIATADINNTAYLNSKVLQIEWVGLKYVFTPKLDLTGAYYHYSQNSYSGNGCSDTSSSKCSGTLNAYSLVGDYKLAKRWDVYGGTMWSGVKNGIANGYLHTSTVDLMVGARFNF